MKYKTLVLSGGGTKGILHLGVVHYLEENNLAFFDTYIGSSVGSLITGLLAVGYTGQELFNFILHFDMTTLKNFNFSNFLSGYGLDNGDIFIFVFKKLIEKKINMPEITFGQLYKKFKKKLIICATCLNETKPYYFSYKNNPDMPIYLAVRMSIAIPFIFTSVLYDGKIFSDGGLVDHYPIEQSENIDETIGVYLDGIKICDNINNLEEFTLSVFLCFLKTTENISKKYNKNTIYIPSNNISNVNFTMTNTEKLSSFVLGQKYCKKYINDSKLLIDNTQDNEDNNEINKYITKQIDKPEQIDKPNKKKTLNNLRIEELLINSDDDF